MIAPLQPTEAPKTWTVAELLGWTEGHLKRLGFATPRLDAEVLLAHALGAKRLDLYTGWSKVVESAERARFRESVQRRSRHEPVAYITGSKEFYSLAFEVTTAVLVPRPETEHLIDLLVARIKPGDPESAPLQILDLGTGSGCLAITAAVKFAAAQVVAVDVSEAALAVARRNAERHGVADRVRFLEGDLFAPLSALGPESRFDAILSNPPYIRAGEFQGLEADVRDHEPRLALVDHRDGRDGDGTSFHRAIVARSREFLLPGGFLAVEVGMGQAEPVATLFQQAGLESIETIRDYGNVARVVLGSA